MKDDQTTNTDVNSRGIVQLADGDLASVVAAEMKLIEGMSRSDARECIDKKTSSLRQSMLALASIRNTLIAMDSLPDEIWVEVFFVLAQSLRPSLDSEANVHPLRVVHVNSWLAVARVCRRWRKIALWTPRLYTFVDARSLSQARLFLARSRNLPVDVYLHSNVSSLNVHATMTEIRAHLPRIKELTIQIRSKSMVALRSHIDSLPAPMLQSLRLEQTSVRHSIVAAHDAVIFPEMFHGQTPCLRELCLSHVSIPWTSPIWSGLRELHLTAQHPTTTPSIETFLRVLESCPLLGAISLIYAGPSLDTDILEYPPPIRVVELPRLHEIYLSPDRPIDAQYVLAHLSLPPTALITVYCELEHSNQGFSAVLPRDCTTLKCLSSVRRLRLDVKDIQTVNLTGYMKTGQMVLSLGVYVGVQNDGILKPRLFFPQFPRFFQLEHLEELQLVDCAAHMSSEGFVEVLSKLTSLIRLTASESSPAGQRQLLTALALPSLSEPDGVVCPALKVLRFSGLDEKERVVDNVAHTCRSRGFKGAPLDTLNIAGFQIDSLFSLLDIVSAVDVDASWVNEVSSSANAKC